MPHLGLQMSDVGARDIGRIGHDEVEGTTERRGKIAGRENARASKGQDRRVGTRRCQRAGAAVGSDAECVRQFDAARRAGSRPIRCRDRRCAACRFGDRGRHRAPLRRRFRFPAAAPVCPAKAGTANSRIPGGRDAGDGFAIEAARCQCGQCLHIVIRQCSIGFARKLCVIDRERRADQQPRIESADSMPSSRSRPANRRRACVTDIPGDSFSTIVMTRRTARRAERPGFRSRVHR